MQVIHGEIKRDVNRTDNLMKQLIPIYRKDSISSRASRNFQWIVCIPINLCQNLILYILHQIVYG